MNQHDTRLSQTVLSISVCLVIAVAWKLLPHPALAIAIGLPVEDGPYLTEVVQRFFHHDPEEAGMTPDGLAALQELSDCPTSATSESINLAAVIPTSAAVVRTQGSIITHFELVGIDLGSPVPFRRRSDGATSAVGLMCLSIVAR